MAVIAEGEEESSSVDLPEEPSDDPDADYNFQSAFMWKKINLNGEI